MLSTVLRDSHDTLTLGLGVREGGLGVQDGAKEGMTEGDKGSGGDD